MTFFEIIIFCAILSYICFRNSFFGLKLLAGMSWIVFMLYVKNNPPSGIVEGSAVHTGLLVVSIGFALMIVLAGLGRGIKTQQSTSINGTMQTVEQEGFHLPKWMSNISSEDLELKERKEKTADSLNDYRQTLRNAYNSGRTRRNGR